MAARRERERRRPNTERRYRFATSEPDIAPEEQVLEEELEEAGEIAAPPPARRTAARDGASTTRTTEVRTPTRSFTDFRSEYAYVVGDLRRIAAVVGSLLAILIVLYFILPH
jgi:hypothetical protein